MSTMTAPAALTRRPAAVRASEAPRTPVRTVRLTRRGRVAVAALFVAAGVAVVGLAQPQALALGQQQDAAVQRITVHPGETLWAIAGRVAPDADPRDTVARIEDMNDLDSSTVPAGSVLLVPRAH